MIADATAGGLGTTWGWLFPGLAVGSVVLMTTRAADRFRDRRLKPPR